MNCHSQLNFDIIDKAFDKLRESFNKENKIRLELPLFPLIYNNIPSLINKTQNVLMLN